MRVAFHRSRDVRARPTLSNDSAERRDARGPPIAGIHNATRRRKREGNAPVAPDGVLAAARGATVDMEVIMKADILRLWSGRRV